MRECFKHKEDIRDAKRIAENLIKTVFGVNQVFRRMDNPNIEGVNFHYYDTPTNAGAVTSNYAYKTDGNKRIVHLRSSKR